MKTLAAYLNQGDVWMSKAGPYPIASMDVVYRRRALHWLTRNSAELFRWFTNEAYVEAPETPDLETLIKWIDSRPSNWIKTTPLYRALQAGLPPELTP
ncbi:hypothetical protein ACIBI0_38765 [Microbispora rosea]|uniref:hypothetical protein n=1 Tax=Microbispora rosea TaxID=58117 RepID=UPI0037B730B9